LYHLIVLDGIPVFLGFSNTPAIANRWRSVLMIHRLRARKAKWDIGRGAVTQYN
jgi:hypothetical protein